MIFGCCLTLLRRWCFSIFMETLVFLKHYPTSQKLRFRFLRTWGFASKTLSHGMYSSSTCSLLSSAFALHPAPCSSKKLSERVQSISVSMQSHNSSCRNVRSSGTSAENPPALLVDDLAVWHEELRAYRKHYYFDLFRLLPGCLSTRTNHDPIIPNGSVRDARSDAPA